MRTSYQSKKHKKLIHKNNSYRLLPSSSWKILKLFSLITAHREYTAMLNMPMVPLASSIMDPKKCLNDMTFKKDEGKIIDTMNKFHVNRPQAEAILGAIGIRSGFVLIQGKR